MPAVSQQEYLRRSTGQDTADEQAEQMTGHLDGGPVPRPAPAAPLVRPFAARRYGSSHHTRGATTARPDRSQDGGQVRQPSAGHAAGVPAFPAPLPGSHDYQATPATAAHAPLDVGPAKPYYSGGMAHGVPAPPHHGGRPAPPPAQQLAARARQAAAEETGRPADPVPVYIVTKGAGARPMRRAALRQVAIGAPGADSQIIVPRNPHRRVVSLLNESANPVRITGDLTLSGGALLPASMTSYKDFETQDQICAYQPAGNSGAALISIIDQYDVADGG